jgi:hypothetical protein
MSVAHPKQCGLVLLAIGVLLFSGAPSAQALSVSPPIFEYNVRPGDEIAGAIQLYNETDATETFFPTVQDFVASGDETGTPHFLAEGTSSSTSIAPWVGFETPAVTLEPGDTRYVAFTIQVPEGTASGSYFGGLLMSTAPPRAQSGLATVSKVGALVLISVQGDAVESGEILEFAATPKTASSLPVTFDVRFENTGAVHLAPFGEIHITNMLGGGSATIPVNIAGGYVLPNSSRRFTASWQKSEVTEDAIELVQEWKNFGLGLYEATLVMSYGADDTVTTAQARFWIIPWQLLILLTIAIVTLILLARSYNVAAAGGETRRT